MDLNDVMNYAFVITGSAAVASVGFLTATAVYGLGLAAIQTIFHSSKINSKSELESVVEQEAVKLDLDPSKINIIYPSLISKVQRNKHGAKLHISNNGMDRSTVKHELYHIKKDKIINSEDKAPLYKYVWLHESRATLYGCFNIKL